MQIDSHGDRSMGADRFMGGNRIDRQPNAVAALSRFRPHPPSTTSAIWLLDRCPIPPSSWPLLAKGWGDARRLPVGDLIGEVAIGSPQRRRHQTTA